jgi:hypothetical protein
MSYSQEIEEMEHEHGAAMGDPRRCKYHPTIATSSPDGMFDAPCPACEFECSEAAAAWASDPNNPNRSDCALDLPYVIGRNAYRGIVSCLHWGPSDDEIPF